MFRILTAQLYAFLKSFALLISSLCSLLPSHSQLAVFGNDWRKKAASLTLSAISEIF